MTHDPSAHRLESQHEDVSGATHGRRSFLHMGAAGIGAAVIGANHVTANPSQARKQRATERLVGRLFEAIETGSTSAIWSFFADDGYIVFPFVGTRFSDLASFDAEIGPLLAALPGLTFTDLELQFLDDPEALIAKYKGHAIVTFTGKSYDQTYITEIHTKNGKVTSYAEYFDTAVINEAFTP